MQHDAVRILQMEVGIGVLAPQGERHLPRFAQREAVVVRPVVPPVHRIPVGPRPVQRREVAKVGGAGRRRVGIGRRHPHRVAAGVAAVAARSDVMGAGLGRGEGQTRVGVLAAIVVAGPGDALAVGVVQPAQHRVPQRTAAAGRPHQVDDVGAARHQLDGEPVDVVPLLDLTRGTAADLDGAGRPGVRPEIVSHERLLRSMGGSSLLAPRPPKTIGPRRTHS